MTSRHAQGTSPRLIGAKRAADEYGLAHSSLRDIVHRGELPVIRVGRAWYFERRDLDRWIENQKSATTA
jgi:excisionase family DNA binding protein